MAAEFEEQNLKLKIKSRDDYVIAESHEIIAPPVATIETQNFAISTPTVECGVVTPPITPPTRAWLKRRSAKQRTEEKAVGVQAMVATAEVSTQTEVTLPEQIPAEWRCIIMEQDIALPSCVSSAEQVDTANDERPYVEETEVDWSNKEQVDKMEKRQRAADVQGVEVSELPLSEPSPSRPSPSKESIAATDDSYFDFTKMDEDEGDFVVATGTARNMIDHWNSVVRYKEGVVDESAPLVYDDKGFDQFGVGRPSHWSKTLADLTGSADHSRDGRKMIRLEGDPKANIERLESTRADTDHSIRESEEGTNHLTDEAGPKLQDHQSTEDKELNVCGEELDVNMIKHRPARAVGSRRMKMARGMTVDSGAADNVMPRRMVRGKFNRVRPSAGSRRGVHYVAANNARIANQGECDFKFSTKEGQEESFTFQIAEVNKALCAVSYLVDTKHRVVFDQDEDGNDISMITNKKTGKQIRMVRARNVWSIEAFIDEEYETSDEAEPDGFGRLGR